MCPISTLKFVPDVDNKVNFVKYDSINIRRFVSLPIMFCDKCQKVLLVCYRTPAVDTTITW